MSNSKGSDLSTVIKGCVVLIGYYIVLMGVCILLAWSFVRTGYGLLANEKDVMPATTMMSVGIGILCMVAAVFFSIIPFIGGERAWWPVTVLVYILLAVGLLCILYWLIVSILAS